VQTWPKAFVSLAAPSFVAGTSRSRSSTSTMDGAFLCASFHIFRHEALTVLALALTKLAQSTRRKNAGGCGPILLLLL
jgi:hypothetical protein